MIYVLCLFSQYWCEHIVRFRILLNVLSHNNSSPRGRRWAYIPHAKYCTNYTKKKMATKSDIYHTVYQCLKMYVPFVNKLRPRKNGHHFPDDIFKWLFLDEIFWISIEIILRFVPRGPLNNIPTLIYIMAWCRSGDKPLSEPMMTQNASSDLNELTGNPWCL